jgi:lipopolysaccharide transport system ATP-binding protein
METVIEVNDVKKRYDLGSIGGSTLISDIKGLFIPNTKRDKIIDTDEQYWALKGVTFDVKQGEVLGIIGRNGAGKSTLLKILSRVTSPTLGSIKAKGRIASLLEVGTGFHPDLSGRDNIYLNGAILGMKKAEITRKLEEIVEFAGIAKYIDTPVKRYSSGMYVRLAFAVAAHLEPEILILDEVLAVGDAEFQKKCLGKMKDVSEGGRTVLFVSHNMSAINSLCTRTVYLKNGVVGMVGETGEVVKNYLSSYTTFNYKIEAGGGEIGDEYAKLISARLIKPDGTDATMITVSDRFGIEMNYEILKEGSKPGPNFLLSTQEGEKVFQSLDTDVADKYKPGVYKSVAWIPANFLNDLSYKLTLCVTTHNPTKIHFEGRINFEIYDDVAASTRGDYKGTMHGYMRPKLEWQTQKY